LAEIFVQIQIFVKAGYIGLRRFTC